MGSVNPSSTAIRAAGFQMKPDQLDIIRSSGWTSVRGEIAEGYPVNILDEGIGAGVHFTHQFGIPGIGDSDSSGPGSRSRPDCRAENLA